MERQVCKNVSIAADKNLHLCSAKNSLWPNDCGVMTVTCVKLEKMACSLPVFHCPIPRKNILLAFVLLLWSGGQLLAQCDRIGRVTDLTPGCGAVIKDLSTGQFFRAISGIEPLVGGETIRFGAAPSPGLTACSTDGLPAMSLLCTSDLLAAEAHFTYFASPDHPLQYTFHAELDQPDTQTCQWSFGDGPLHDFPGGTVQHTFSESGLHTVCLKIIDADGITTHHCREILVSTAAVTPCGYDVFMTAVGTQLYARLLPQNSHAGLLTSIGWQDGPNGSLLGNTSDLLASLPGYGPYSICATYAVKDLATDSICTATICTAITLPEPGCASAQIAALVPTCPTKIVPVCGCNNVTYENECDALAAGLTTWWAGDCNSIYGSCLADLQATVIAGNPELGYTVQFRNLSAGNFHLTYLDFGDGSPIWEATQWDSVLHHYAKGDVYRIDLSVWKYGACVSSVTKMLVTDASNLTAANLVTAPGYVLPGDANGDEKANVYDLLDIGVGYFTYGAPRPNATTNWVPQFAANWPEHLTPALQNYKHLDGDGNGIVTDLDVDVIEPHYSPIESDTVLVIPGAPAVWVEFEQDTIIVDANNPVPLEITASVMVGSPEAPALGLYGVAFALKYPEFVDHDPEAEYKNEFFGISNHILWLPKDNYNLRQLDLGFTEKYAAASGYGRIATVTFRADFIIIIDVIAREAGAVKAFTVPVCGLKAVDANGQEFEIGAAALQDTIWIKLPSTSGTHDRALRQQVRLYPNPTTGETRIFTGDLDVEHVEAVNALGQVVYAATPIGGQVQRLSAANWVAGLYTVRLQTKQGVVEKKLLVL